jgi:ABC-type multidrug transport system ATPase subunit
MTIHQPNSEIYSLFDNLILMIEGKIIYQGKSSEANAYFANNFNLKCPSFSNPADFFMSIIHH